MADVPEPLKKQVGPFPLYGWLLIIGAGVGLGLLLRRTGVLGGGKSEPDLPEEVTDNAGNPVAGAPLGPTGRVPVSGPPGVGAGASPVTQTPITSNVEWQRRAIEWLTSNGFDGIVAAQTIGKYLDAQTLNAQEQTALSLVIKALGAPPEYIPTPQTEPSQPLPGGRPDPTAPPLNEPGPSGVGMRTVVVPSDGDIAQFVTDWRTLEWIPPTGPGRFPQNITNQADAQGFPIPQPISRAQVNALTKRGPAPQYPADYSGPRTAW